MATQTTLRHTTTGLIKPAPIGFSWTVFFFGGFPALFRGDLKWAVIMWVGGAAAVLFAVITLGALFFLPWVFWFVFAFIYNKRYVTELLGNGFVPADGHSANVLAQAGVAVGQQPYGSDDRDEPAAPKNIETAILRVASQRGGLVTPSLLAVDGDYGLDEVKSVLDEMVSAGHAELRIRRPGDTVYAFPEMLSDENREGSGVHDVKRGNILARGESLSLGYSPRPTRDVRRREHGGQRRQLKRLMLAACVALVGAAPGILADSDQADLGWQQPYGPSYDCGKTQTAVERTVCDDPLLARLDLEMSAAYDIAIEEGNGVMAFEQWLGSRNDECRLDFDFDTQIDERFEATSCLIAAYAKRLVELGQERRVLDALVDVGFVELRSMEFDLGSVRIDLPRMLPTMRHEPKSFPAPHPACIHKLLQSGLTKFRRDACHAGTAHLKVWDDSKAGDTAYLKWYPNRFDQQGDLFGYRQLGALSDDRTVIKVIEQITVTRGTTTWSPVFVLSGVTEADTIAVERIIHADGMVGFCDSSVGEVAVVDSHKLRLSKRVSVEDLVNLLEWFPEQLRGVSPSTRRRLVAMQNDLSVPMSILGSSCIGRVHYDLDLETDIRTLIEVSIYVTQANRESLADFPAITCLLDMMDGRLPDISMSLSPSDMENMAEEFVETCGPSEH